MLFLYSTYLPHQHLHRHHCHRLPLQGVPQPLASPGSVGYNNEVPLEDGSEEYGSVQILKDLSVPLEPIKLSSSDEKPEDQLKTDPKEDEEPEEEEEPEEDHAEV